MLKDFKMDELRILCAIAETASVSRAAQRLNMPQSNVSRTLTSVERKVGSPFFCAPPWNWCVPSSASSLFTPAAPFLSSMSSLSTSPTVIKTRCRASSPLGRPSASTSFGRYILPALRKTLPELQINLVTRNASEREQKYGAIFNSDCDLLISPFKPQNENLIARPFTRFRTGVFASRITRRNTLSPSRRRWWIMSASPCACWAAATISGPSKAKTANRSISR